MRDKTFNKNKSEVHIYIYTSYNHMIQSCLNMYVATLTMTSDIADIITMTS